VGSRDLALAEIERHPWHTLRCGCGEPAGHVAQMLRTIVQATDPEDHFGAVLSGHLEVDGNLFEVAVPAVSVILAALAGELEPAARNQLVGALCVVVAGEPHHTEVAAGRTHLREECRYHARHGIWTILHHGFGKNRDDVVDIIEMLELDDARRDYYLDVLRARKVKSHRSEY
jgi:hypothetical protein